MQGHPALFVCLCKRNREQIMQIRTKVTLLLVLFDKKSKSRVQTAKNQV